MPRNRNKYRRQSLTEVRGWGDGSSPRAVGWQYAKDKVATTTSLRGLGAGGFHIAAATLEELGFGTVCKNGTTIYKAERAMPGQT